MVKIPVSVINGVAQVEPVVITENSVNQYAFEFSFSENWDGLIKKVLFQRKGSTDTTVMIVDLVDNLCFIPFEVLQEKGSFKMSVVGNGEDGQVFTTALTTSEIADSLDVNGSVVPPEPTPSEYNQMLQMVNKIVETSKDIAETAKETQASAENAENSAIQAELSAKTAETQANLALEKVGEINIKVASFELEISQLKIDVELLLKAMPFKVDKKDGYGLSKNDFTDAYKLKLDSIESHFKGHFTNLTDLEKITGSVGDYAYVNLDGVVVEYLWDDIKKVWQADKSASTSETAESIKQKYESNIDTNAFTDNEKEKLSDLNNYNDTALKNSLNSHVASLLTSVDGIHGIRYFNNKLAYFDGQNWVNIETGGGIAEIPVAQDYQLGGITALEATEEFTQEIRINRETGRLYAKPNETFRAGVLFEKQSLTYDPKAIIQMEIVPVEEEI